uniref:Uncharacterized protein n=1 Tax=Rhipicephalus pulchellus TaxID=72859 RepID=L7LZ23_RHIPC
MSVCLICQLSVFPSKSFLLSPFSISFCVCSGLFICQPISLSLSLFLPLFPLFLSTSVVIFLSVYFSLSLSVLAHCCQSRVIASHA